MRDEKLNPNSSTGDERFNYCAQTSRLTSVFPSMEVTRFT